MSLFDDRDPRFRGLNLKVAAFLLVALAAAIGLFVVLAERQGYLQPKTDILVEAPTGSDLRAGMAVKLSGFKIGEVRDVSLNEAARVDVLMRLEDRYLRWVKADSVVSVAREGLIGDSFLVVSAGSPQLPALREGERLNFEPTPGLADIAQDLRARTLPVIDGMTELLGYLNDPKGDFRAGVGDLRRLVAELRETRSRLDALLEDTRALANDDIKRTLGSADRTLATLESQVTTLTGRVDASLQKLDAATSGAARAVDSASPRLDQLLEEADAAVRDARKLMDGAGRRWPFKGGQAPADEPEAGAAPEVPPGGAPARP